MSIETLWAAFANATWPVELNEDFITAGGAPPPPMFDELLIRAFVLGSANALKVCKGSVGRVIGDSFKITGASLPNGVFGATEDQTAVTLTFTLPARDSTQLEVLIQTDLLDWSFSAGFPAMVGPPFEFLVFSRSSLLFSTTKLAAIWPTDATSTITLTPGMTFAGELKLDSYAQSILAIAELYEAVSNPLVMSGPIDASGVSDETIFPVMNLIAPVSKTDRKFRFLFIEASGPFFQFQIDAAEFDPPPAVAFMPNSSVSNISGDDDGDDYPLSPEQPMSYIFGAVVSTMTDPALSLGFSVLLQSDTPEYAISLAPPENAPPLTSANLAKIAGLNVNYIAYVPAPLQSAFTEVAFKGLSISATVFEDEATISSTALLVGTADEFRYTLIKDPYWNLTIESLDLHWTVLDPMGEALQLLLFQTTFTFMPTVFKTSNGKDGGEFTLSIDKDFIILAEFDGQVSLADLLRDLTHGLVQMPAGVEVIFNDVQLLIDPPNNSYAFSLGVDVVVDVIKWDGKPLIQLDGMRMALSAQTPQNKEGATKYLASMAGLLAVGPIALNVSIVYDSTGAQPYWRLSSALAAPLDLGCLLNDLFAVANLKTFLPDFLPETLTVESFQVGATIPIAQSGESRESRYQISGFLHWKTKAFPRLPIDCKASLALAYDGARPGKEFSGAVLGSISVDAVAGLTVSIAYAFNQPDSEGGSTLAVSWQGITGVYDNLAETITVTLNGWSPGSLITSLVQLTGRPYFSLSGPWAALNAISLNGLKLIFNLAEDAETTVSVTYTIPAPIDLGFLVIDGFRFTREPDTGKVLISLSGRSPLSKSSEAWESLFDPKKGQDVTKLPEVPGRGNSLFDLRLLGLGQHVAVRNSDMKSIPEVIKSLKDIPATRSGMRNPVDPGNEAEHQPYYDANIGWLIATDFGLFRIPETKKNEYSIDVMVVFNDPNVYGLRLGFNGDKIKVLDGLYIDILYKKVTPTIGVYQIELCLPGSIRQINLGAMNITLPIIGIAIYTNGDFMFDVGFPYNMNFSRSFTIQAVVGPFPVMGSGGFYLAKLSNDTSTKIPKTHIGVFNPVIEFGIGLQMGLGYSIDKGILSAGFSITFYGIIQGVFAPWRPYPPPAISQPRSSALTVQSTDIQADNYFYLQGQFGIQGKLYGSINFAIISASLSVSIVLTVQIVYESYRAIPLSITASVSVSVSVKIDLGIFSFKISFAFTTTISQDMTIGSNSQAPWDALPDALGKPIALRSLSRRHALQRPTPVALRFAPQRRANRRTTPSLPTLTIVLTPQFTVLAPDVAKLTQDDQQGAFVALFSMDAPTADGDCAKTESSFVSLCDALLPWVITAHPDLAGAQTNSALFADTPVSIDTLKDILASLANPATQPALAAADILAFLKSSFVLDFVTTPTLAQQQDLQAGAVIFPAMPGLGLIVPSPAKRGDTVAIDFETWTQITPAYRTAVIAVFDALAAKLNNEINPPAPKLVSADTTPESLAQVLFEDAFALIARQLLQAAIDCYASFPYLLKPNDSLTSIMAWAQGVGATDHNPHFTAADLVNANAKVPLSGGVTLYLDGIAYAVQTQVDPATGAPIVDSLNDIAARFSQAPQFTTTPAALILANQTSNTLLQPGVTITVDDNSVVTALGDTFAGMAGALDVPIETLAEQASVYDLHTLLLAGAPMIIPTVAYTTVADGGDTLGVLLARFGVGVDAFLSDSRNLAATDIFDMSKEPLVYLSKLILLTGQQLADGVKAGETIGQTAGMVSRFMLQGLRLPNATGLALSPSFLYPVDQPQYGLYQLSGQQFPFRAYGASYKISLTKAPALDWVQINGDTGSDSGDTDLSAAAANLAVVLGWAVANGYNPSAVRPPLTLERAAAVALQPQQFAPAGYARWTTSGMDELNQLTRRPGARPAPALDGAGQVQPFLWRLPPALISRIEAHQAALVQDIGLEAAICYLPAFAPATLTTDPASQLPIVTALDQYTFASRIDVQIRRLDQASGAQTQTASSNTVLPPGDGNAPPVTQLAPNVYQLIGPNPSDAILLERILIQMNTPGTPAISGVLIGYPDAEASLPGLIGHAAHDVYTFITRANLSTKANPPQRLTAETSQPEPVNNFVNAPIDAVRLLWELSTVQSGGYSFYWDARINGAELPPGLFDDSGYATLTLLITYARPTGAGSPVRLSNVCNAVLTCESIDPSRSTVVLISETAPNTATIKTGDTLADFARRYGMTAGALARDNPDAPLARASRFDLVGLFHEVSPADIETTDVWDTVAKHYSIAAKDLQAANQGIRPVLYAVLMIPKVTYSAVEHDTLRSVANHFKITLEQVGAAAQACRIANEPELKVDPQSFSISSLLGEGNVGLTLTRVNLPSPGDAGEDNYGQNYMFSLYTLLDMGFRANQFFSGSAQGMPFGPSGDGLPPVAEPNTAVLSAAAPARRAAKIRNPASRRALLQSQAELPTLAYQQALTVYNNALINPAPARPEHDLPPASQNPYRSVGGVAQLSLRWLDLFGNQTVTPFNAPPKKGYRGPLNHPPIPIGYTDTLIALSQWPNVSATYVYTGEINELRLQITLALNTAAYQPDEATGEPAPSAANDAKVFDAVYFQLNQTYNDAIIPDVSGPAVSFFLLNTLTGKDLPLRGPLADRFINFANLCAHTVRGAAKGVAPEAPVEAVLSIPIETTDIVNKNVIRLRVVLTQRRQARLVDPSLLEVDGGVSVQTEIQPFTDTSGTVSDALGPFADAMEIAFANARWRYRVGAGPADPNAPVADQTYTVWAVRFKETDTAEIGLTYTIGNDPVFYAPKPVARERYSGSVPLKRYVTSKGLEDCQGAATTFTGVDMNLWCAQTLTSIDTFLSPTYAAPAFIVEALQMGETEQPGVLSNILTIKAKLAETIASTLESVLVGDTSDVLKRAAQEELKQSLLQKLSNAAAVTAVVVLPVVNATTNEPPAPGVSSPVLYGSLFDPTQPTAGSFPNYTLSSASIPLNDEDARSKGSSLAFLFTCADPSLDAAIKLTLKYRLTHLQTDITAVPGIDGYKQSTWIAFVNPIPASPIGAGALTFPVPLRGLPPPPTAQAQSGLGSALPQPPPADLTLWNYDFTYAAQHAAQDSLFAKVTFNDPTTAKRTADATTQALFEALAQIISLTPAIFTDFDHYLTKVAPDTSPTCASFLNAKCALAAWETLVSDFAKAYDGWANPSYQSLVLIDHPEGPLPTRLQFRVELGHDEEGAALVEVIYVAEAQAPLPVIEIEPDAYEAEAVNPRPDRALVAYRYRNKTTTDYMTLAHALTVQARTVGFRSISAIEFQSANTTITIHRNIDLVPERETNDAFVFNTVPVAFGTPVIPFIRVPAFDLSEWMPPERKHSDIGYYLTQFFEQLLGDNGVEYMIAQVGVDVRYPLNDNPASPVIELPVALMPPTKPNSGAISDVAKVANAWLAANRQPLPTFGATLNFQVILYGDLHGTTMPLVQIPSAFIALTDVH